MVEELRETPFWERLLQVTHIFPSVENGYAEHYEQTAVGAP